jgi:hypothetical protein
MNNRGGKRPNTSTNVTCDAHAFGGDRPARGHGETASLRRRSDWVIAPVNCILCDGLRRARRRRPATGRHEWVTTECAIAKQRTSGLEDPKKNRHRGRRVRPNRSTCAAACGVGFSEGWQGKRMTGWRRDRPETKQARGDDPRAQRAHSPALTWLSLVRLLPSRARLRFTRRVDYSTELTKMSVLRKIIEIRG